MGGYVGDLGDTRRVLFCEEVWTGKMTLTWFGKFALRPDGFVADAGGLHPQDLRRTGATIAQTVRPPVDLVNGLVQS